MTVLIFYDRGGGLIQSTLDWYDPEDERELLRIAHPRKSHGKLRRGLARLREQEAAWNAAATPAQQAIGWGDCWRRRREGSPDCPPTVIYGRVMPLFEFIKAERRACENTGVPPGEAEEEIERGIARVRRGYARGWRHGWAFSALEPAGEIGAAHVATLEPVSEAEFLAARRDGWP